jgi:hypothetical protein
MDMGVDGERDPGAGHRLPRAILVFWLPCPSISAQNRLIFGFSRENMRDGFLRISRDVNFVR